MGTYPILLIPHKIQEAMSLTPPLPQPPSLLPLPEAPSPPVQPQPLEVGVLVSESICILFMGLLLSMNALSILIVGFVAISFHVFQMRRSFPRRLRQFEAEIGTYESETQKYTERKESTKAENDRRQQEYAIKIKHIQRPQNIARFRQNKIAKILQDTLGADRENSSARRGRHEEFFAKYLKKYFGHRIHIKLSLTIPDFYYPYTPDFAYIHETGMHIDIELDEPYTQQGPIHYSGRDDKRNAFFLGKGWVVLRFAEEQVVLYPERCCKEVAKVIANLSNNPDVLECFAETPDLTPIPQWDYSQALLWMDQRRRENYHKLTQS